MNERARGFSVTELLIATLLSAFVIAAVYEALALQMRSYGQANPAVGTQRNLHTALEGLQAELREVDGRAGDIRGARPESLTVRALRKAGVVCAVGTTTVQVYAVGTPFAERDSLLLFATRAPGPGDDTVRLAAIPVGGITAPTTCTRLTGTPWDSLKSDVNTLSLTRLPSTWGFTDLNPGDQIRSFETVTYGIFRKGDRYVLGRRAGADTVVALFGPLASPAQGGLLLTYLNTQNQPIAASDLPARKDSIARVRVSLRGSDHGVFGSSRYGDSLVTELPMRGSGN